MQNLDLLVKELISLPTETEWLEFKHNNFDQQMIGQDISSFQNGFLCRESFIRAADCRCSVAFALFYFFRQNCNFLIYIASRPAWCLFCLYGVTNHERNHPFQQSIEHD